MNVWAERIKKIKAEIWASQEAAEIYHQNVYADQGIIKVKNLVEVQHVLEHARGSVLDVGTGTGRFAIPLCDAGHKVTGTDISPHMLTVATSAAGSRSIDWIVGDACCLPFPDESFDTVVSINAITHLPQWELAVAEFKRVCRKGGRLIFDSCSGDLLNLVNKDEVKYGTRTKLADEKLYLNEITVEKMCSFLESIDVSVNAIIPNNFLNSNFLIEDIVGPGYGPFIEKTKEMLVLSDTVFRFWCFVEKHLIPRLPPEYCYGYLVVATNTPGTVFKPSTPGLTSPATVLKFLEYCLGDKTSIFLNGCRRLVYQGRALEFLQLLVDTIVKPFDPVFDLMSMLELPRNEDLTFLNQCVEDLSLSDGDMFADHGSTLGIEASVRKFTALYEADISLELIIKDCLAANSAKGA
ncbi:MAG: class I SAM-dependent methyltransferase [Candidatus Melainabacteria bacterium]|nr:class I SAM-dependent methyltransferase [Candidatus Melainabacteria bacterium]